MRDLLLSQKDVEKVSTPKQGLLLYKKKILPKIGFRKSILK
jgi:hypothetical protein